MRPRAQSDDFRQFMADQLAALSGVHFKAMFGGYGLYQDHTFFGIVHRGRLYFKTTPKTVKAYQAAGRGPFQPNARQTLRHYFEVPVAILEDAEALVQWAQEAIEATREKTLD